MSSRRHDPGLAALLLAFLATASYERLAFSQDAVRKQSSPVGETMTLSNDRITIVVSNRSLVTVLDEAAVADLREWTSEIEAWPAGSHLWGHYAEATANGPAICRTERLTNSAGRRGANPTSTSTIPAARSPCVMVLRSHRTTRQAFCRKNS